MFKEYKGHNGSLIIESDKVTLMPSNVNAVEKSPKVMMIQNITEIHIKQPGLFKGPGYIEILANGETIDSNRTKRDILQSVSVITLLNAQQYEGMIQAKKLIESYKAVIGSAPTTAPNTSAMDEIKKAAELRDTGIISDEEFQNTKKKLLG
ncbi:SHOCT domain-containing protein [Gorillibacterium massiliense]|uniref:SHOCT domain-containing protein n=1 Tax=Gorillibacterium massiliense TaxID=1280390 RepID=UPI0005948949|nr:SHOCT domain-containing protein [Gorillibacterium massiliense]